MKGLLDSTNPGLKFSLFKQFYLQTVSTILFTRCLDHRFILSQLDLSVRPGSTIFYKLMMYVPKQSRNFAFKIIIIIIIIIIIFGAN